MNIFHNPCSFAIPPHWKTICHRVRQCAYVNILAHRQKHLHNILKNNLDRALPGMIRQFLHPRYILRNLRHHHFFPIHLQDLTAYIHINAQHHGMVDKFQQWRFTSYHLAISSEHNTIQSNVLPLFGGKAKCIDFHKAFIQSREAERVFTE